MIGNDVVDLRDAETRPGATHPRFDARVFTAVERDAIAASADPHRCRWRFWAAKEAAYKAARKLDERTVFSPVRFRVGDGVVVHRGSSFALELEEGVDFVHAIVCAGGGPGTARPTQDERRMAERGILRLTSESGTTASAAVRAAVCAAAAASLGADPHDLAIVTRRRIPHLEIRGRSAGVDLSLSHHGTFVAYAFEVPLPPGEELFSALRVQSPVQENPVR